MINADQTRERWRNLDDNLELFNANLVILLRRFVIRIEMAHFAKEASRQSSAREGQDVSFGWKCIGHDVWGGGDICYRLSCRE